MNYRMGYCPQCDAQVMVQDVMGQWNTFKPNYRQANLLYSNGHKVRTIICKTCLATPDLKKINDAIVADDSQASSKDVLKYIKTLGEPTAIHEYSMKAGR